MAKITIKEVVHVAGLAKLNLNKEEISKFQKQLSSVVDYISQLSQVDTSNLEPTSQTTGLENVLRSDEVKINKVLELGEAVSGTDKVFNGYFYTNPVITKNKNE